MSVWEPHHHQQDEKKRKIQIHAHIHPHKFLPVTIKPTRAQTISMAMHMYGATYIRVRVISDITYWRSFSTPLRGARGQSIRKRKTRAQILLSP